MNFCGAGDPVQVMVTKRDADGILTRTPLEHRIYLGAAAGDGPARANWACWLGHTAKLGCGFCIFSGVAGPGGGVYFRGYAEPCLQEAGSNEGNMCLFNDQLVHLSDK